MGRKDDIAKEMGQVVPIFLMHMFPYVFQAIDVPPSQVLALICIEQRELCNSKDLTGDMHVSAPTVSGIIARLEKSNFITREVSTEDRRVSHLFVTSAGNKIVKQLRSNIEKRWGYILSKLKVDQGETIIAMMRNLTKGFKDGTI
jgi:DNA-binding MarR family transcriptional regulator